MNTKRITTFASPLHVIGRDPLITYQVVMAIAKRDKKKAPRLLTRTIKKIWKLFLPIYPKTSRRA